jgi:hypothetical protein
LNPTVASSPAALPPRPRPDPWKRESEMSVEVSGGISRPAATTPIEATASEVM